MDDPELTDEEADAFLEAIMDGRNYVKRPCRSCGVDDGHTDACLLGENERLRAENLRLQTLIRAVRFEADAVLRSVGAEGDFQQPKETP